jgi:hypothetical protein
MASFKHLDDPAIGSALVLERPALVLERQIEACGRTGKEECNLRSAKQY